MQFSKISLFSAAISTVVLLFYTTTWGFAPVGADTLSLLVGFGATTNVLEVMTSPLLSSNPDFSAGPYWRPLSNLLFWFSGRISGVWNLIPLYILGAAIHLVIAFLGSILISLIVPSAKKVVWGSLIFVHPIAADLLPAVSRYQDLFGVFFTLLAGFALARMNRPLAALLMASIAPLFKELYMFAPLAISATILLDDIISRRRIRFFLVGFGLVLASLPLMLRSILDIGFPSGKEGIGNVILLANNLVDLTLVLVVPTHSTKISAVLAVIFLVIVVYFWRKDNVRMLTPLPRAGRVATLFLTFTAAGAISILLLSNSFALRSSYVLVVPTIALLTYICTSAFQNMTAQSSCVLLLTFVCATNSVFAIRSWHLCDDFWKELMLVVNEVTPAKLEIRRSDVFYPWDHLSSNPSCIMRHTLYPLEQLLPNVHISSNRHDSIPISDAAIIWNDRLQEVYIENE